VSGLLDDDELDYAVVEAIPLHQHLGIRRAPGTDPSAVELPDLPQARNHLGGQGGAALFAAAEAASLAALFATFGGALDSVFAVPAEATIRFRRPAVGGATARARLVSDRATVLAAMAAGRKQVVELTMEVVDDQQRLVADARVRWHIGPRRPGSPRALPRRPGAAG
jgi:acyl-coenzyme A thioesterase PaaI-like protein